MRKVVIILSAIVVILIIGVTFLAFNKGLITSHTDVTPIPTKIMLNELNKGSIGEETQQKKGIPDDVKMGNLKSGVIEASNFKFIPDTITVDEGDTVTITFKSTEGVHDFTIDELNVKSKTIQKDSSEEITFIASKKGKFQFYCSVGQHRAMGMTGTLVIN